MKRFLSLVLAFILVFGMLPANSVTAMAYEKDKYDCDINFKEYGTLVRDIKNKEKSKKSYTLKIGIVMNGEYVDTKEAEVLEYNDRFIISDQNIYSYTFNVGEDYELERTYVYEQGDIYGREIEGNKINHYSQEDTAILYYVKEKEKETSPTEPEKPSYPDIAENGEIIKVDWKRTKEGKGNTLTVKKSNRLSWDWGSVPQKLTNFGEKVWDGNTDSSFSGLKVRHSSATWENKPTTNDQSTFRRFKGTFEIPEGYTSKDQIVVSSVAQSLYKEYGNIIPINDDIFIFVYKEGESVDNSNFMDYLAFWTGTSNQNGITKFNGVAGTNTVWLKDGGSLTLGHPMEHTDGWYCEADYDNIGNSLYQNYPDAKEGEKFIIDVIASDYANIGGMDELKISIGKLTDKAVTIKYYEGNVEDGKEIDSVSRKNLKAGEKITLSSDELNLAKDKLSDENIYADGIQVGGEYKVGYDKEQVIKVYYPLKEQQKYKVEHYLMDKDGSYSSKPTVETKTGGLGKNANAVPKEYTHHKIDEKNQNNITKGHITAPEQLVLKLYYARDQYKVSYDANVPQTETIAVPKDETVYAETEVTIADGVVRSGYIFQGWDTEKTNLDDKAYAPDDKFTAEANVTMYAQWEKDNTKWHKVIYNANGGTGLQKDEAEYLNGIDVAVLGKGKIEREHYTFDSWNTQSGGQGTEYQEGGKITAISQGITLYAQWKENDKFTVTYDANAPQGTTLVGEAPVDAKQYYSNNKATVLDDKGMSINNYEFQGWFTEKTGGEKVSGEIAVTGNNTLYAQWKENDKFTVTYDANAPQGTTLVGKAPVDTKQYYSNEKANVASDTGMSIKNHEFQGWFTEKTGGEKVSGETTVTENRTLHAQWKENAKFTVTYDANAPQGTKLVGKAPVDAKQYYSNEKANVASDTGMSINNYEFQGWFTEKTGGEKVSSEITVTGNKTLYAQWKENNKFTVTYDANGGAEKAPSSVTVYDGENVTVASDSLTKKGFERDGWNTSSDAKGTHYADETEFALTENIELFAQWNKTDGMWHKVSYEANFPEGIIELTSGQLPVDENEYLVGEGKTISENNMKISGYTFTGWKAEDDETIYNEGSSYSVRGEKDTLYAQWEKTEGEWFNVIYDANGGKDEPKIAEYNAGTSVTVAEKGEMSKSGFTFDGWADESTDYKVGEKFTMPNSDVTLKAKWIAIQGEISITHRYFTNGSFDGETADESVEVGYEFSIANFLKTLFSSIKYEARISEIKVERRLIEKVEDEVVLEVIPTEIESEEELEEVKTEDDSEKPAEEVKAEDDSEKPAEEVKAEDDSEKPAEEVKAEDDSEKPAEEVKAEDNSEKPAEEVKTEDDSGKPAEEVKAEDDSQKPAEEVKAEDDSQKPAEDAKSEDTSNETSSDESNDVEVLAAVSEDLDETMTEADEKEPKEVKIEEAAQEEKSEEAVKEELKPEWETVNGDSENYIFEEGYEYRVIINYYRTTSSSGGGGSHHRPSHRPSGESSDKTVTIKDEEVPLAQAPELFTIIDDEVPLGKLPKTGGNSLSVTGTMAALAIFSASLKKKYGKNRK